MTQDTPEPASRGFAVLKITADGPADVGEYTDLELAATSALMEITENLNRVLRATRVEEALKTQAVNIFGNTAGHLNKIIAYTVSVNGVIEPSNDNDICVLIYPAMDTVSCEMVYRTLVIGPIAKIAGYDDRVQKSGLV